MRPFFTPLLFMLASASVFAGDPASAVMVSSGLWGKIFFDFVGFIGIVFGAFFVIFEILVHVIAFARLISPMQRDSTHCTFAGSRRHNRGAAPVEYCPTCGEPLVDGECPQGHTIIRCGQCHAILRDGKCPNGCIEREFCPTCNSELVDGECPRGHTIVRCSKCTAVMVNGKCPHCGTIEMEFCPCCNSVLIDRECPRGHTIVRCPDCGSILYEGVCPKGCNADPLNLGWPGGAEKKLGAFALQVVACPKSEGAGFTLRIPDSFVMGRSATNAKEPFVELLTITRKEKAQCSRQYVRMDLDPDGAAFTVTLLNSSRNPAYVGDKTIAIKDEKAKLGLGGHIRLNPGYELELIEAPQEG